MDEYEVEASLFNLERNSIDVFNDLIKILRTSSGGIVLPIPTNEEDIEYVTVCLTTDEELEIIDNHEEEYPTEGEETVAENFDLAKWRGGTTN